MFAATCLLAACLAYQSVRPISNDESHALDLLRRSGASIVEINNDQDGHGLAIDFNKKVSDDALQPLRGLKRLIALRFLGGGVTDIGLINIDQVPNLNVLVIDSVSVTDDGMAEVGKLKSLGKLDLLRCSVSRRGLRKLRGLTKLRRLFLYGTKIKDTDLAPLEFMTQLTYIELPLTVSEQGIARLRGKLPSVRIEKWNGRGGGESNATPPRQHHPS